MTESNDFITFTGIPEVTIPLPEKSDKQIKLDRLRFAVKELVSEFSEPYEKDQYLTATEIIDTIKEAFDAETNWRNKQLDLISKTKGRIDSKPFTF